MNFSTIEWNLHRFSPYHSRDMFLPVDEARLNSGNRLDLRERVSPEFHRLWIVFRLTRDNVGGLEIARTETVGRPNGRDGMEWNGMKWVIGNWARRARRGRGGCRWKKSIVSCIHLQRILGRATFGMNRERMNCYSRSYIDSVAGKRRPIGKARSTIDDTSMFVDCSVESGEDSSTKLHREKIWPMSGDSVAN